MRERTGILSSDFLILGHYLFTAPLDEDHALDEPRDAYNHASAKAMNTLYAQVSSLRTIPESLRAIVRRHLENLSRYTLPR
jgi:hypothetical protein